MGSCFAVRFALRRDNFRLSHSRELVGQTGMPNHEQHRYRGTVGAKSPASLTLVGLGLAGMAGRRWRQRKAS